MKDKEKRKSDNKSADKVRHPIGLTLIAIISLIVLSALGGVTYAVSYFVTADVRNNAEENNLTINSRTASDTENRINSALSSVAMFIDLLSTAGDNTTEIQIMHTRPLICREKQSVCNRSRKLRKANFYNNSQAFPLRPSFRRNSNESRFSP